jgi:O-antigen/teichoic acid export membrane protein
MSRLSSQKDRRISEGKGSRQNTISFLLSILETIVAVGLTAIVSHLLPPSAFGSFSVILSAVFVFGIISQLGVAPIVLRETSAIKSREGGNPYRVWFHADLMVLPTTTLAFIGLIIFFWYADLAHVDAVTVIAVALQLVGLILLSLRSAALQGYGIANFTHIVMCTLPAAFTAIILMAFWIIEYPIDLNAALWANAVGLLIASLALQIRRNRLAARPAVRPRKDKTFIAYLRRQSLPVAGASAVGIFNSNIDILMLGSLAGSIQAGHYTAVMKIATFIAIVRIRLSLLTSHLIPPLFEAEQFSEIQMKCRPVAALSTAVSVAFLTISLLWGADILAVLYGAEFAAAAPVLSLIIFAFTVSSAAGMAEDVFIMTGHQKTCLKIACLSAVVNIALNPLAIYHYGALGAAGTLLASAAVYFIALNITMRRKFGVDVSILGYLGK